MRVQWAGQAYKIASSQRLSSTKKLYSILTAYLSKCLLAQGGVDDEWQIVDVLINVNDIFVYSRAVDENT